MKVSFKQEIVKYSKLLDKKGLVNTLEGNISIYDPNEDLLYITPTRKRKADLKEEMVAVLKNDKQIDGEVKRSSEYLLHQAAIEARPDCRAVVHSHAPFLTAYAYCNKSIEINCSTSFLLAINKIPCLPYGQPGTLEICNGLSDALKESNIVLLGNHGVICVEKDMESCVALIETAEEVMKTYFIATKIGIPVDIPEKEIEALKMKYFASKDKNNNIK